MRAPHVVIGCWDDWGVWEVSSSIYLYSLSVHHARIVQQRVPTPNWMSLSLSSWTTAAKLTAAAAKQTTRPILRFLLNLEASRGIVVEEDHFTKLTNMLLVEMVVT